MRRLFVAGVLLAGCADDGTEDLTMAGSDTSTTSIDAASATAAMTGDSGMVAGSSSGAGDDTSTGAGADPTTQGDSTGGPMSGVFASAVFTIPAGTVVQEFSFQAEADFAPGILDGQTLAVAITDLSHPRRDQQVLCPGNHPLDGCATVDYGAFGTPHDNRITFDGANGPLTVHLYKDRTLQPEPEPLPDFE